MEPIEIAMKAGPYGAAAILAFIWKLERAERLATQLENKQLQERLVVMAGQKSDALAELGEATRDHIKGIYHELKRIGGRGVGSNNPPQA